MNISLNYPSDDFKVIEFPAGEVQVRISEKSLKVYEHSSKYVSLDARLRNSNDVMALIMILDALVSMGVAGIALTLPYLPYTRQDRIAVVGEALSIRAFLRILEPYPITSITTFDVHSDVAAAVWLGKFTSISSVEPVKLFWAETGMQGKDFILLIPDAGATKKADPIIKALKPTAVATAMKKRDVVTGKLSIEVPPLINLPVLVVDDIYDGGGTFIGIAQQLKSDMYLFCTHGIFSKGLNSGLTHFKAIGCMNTYQDFGLEEPSRREELKTKFGLHIYDYYDFTRT